ncbi:MAG: phosphate acetyltransferase [Mycoplasma sp.]|nr:phosphate acetyltransferase [Mycoplasma sp.]
MSKIIKKITEKINSSGKNPTIVFPEGWHEYVVEAALKIKEESNIKPILVVKTDDQKQENGIEYISIESYNEKENLVSQLHEIRKAKGMTIEKAQALIEQPNYFATMLVKLGIAEGYVGGIEYTTADTLRPALQIIKTKKESKIVSSVFIMESDEELQLFADCAININPTAEQVVEITKQVIYFGLTTTGMDEVRAALLSYSTAGSGSGEDAEKMANAYELLKNEDIKNQKVFGSMQFDAAFDRKVMSKKAPELDWKEGANVFVFPNLSAGNIGYKIAQRLGKMKAIGPILLGLAAPVNDLSRGASIQDIIDVSYITATQIIAGKE